MADARKKSTKNTPRTRSRRKSSVPKTAKVAAQQPRDETPVSPVQGTAAEELVTATAKPLNGARTDAEAQDAALPDEAGLGAGLPGSRHKTLVQAYMAIPSFRRRVLRRVVKKLL